MEKNNYKAWLYLAPAILFLGFFMVYPLIDVFIYSFEEGYNSASQSYFGTGLYNFDYILHDPYYNPNLTMDREDFSESDDLRGLKEGRITVQWRE